MTERNIAAEVLKGLREIREHRAGRRTLKTVRVHPITAEIAALRAYGLKLAFAITFGIVALNAIATYAIVRVAMP